MPCVSAGRNGSWGDRPVCLAGPARYLVVVHAVKDGWCALYDTETSELAPLAAT
jgi:hypothetical protein